MSAAGRKCVAYLNTGTFASPVWTALNRITDVKSPQSRGSSDRMYRGAKNKKKVLGYLEYSFAFKYQVKKAGVADTLFDKLEDSNRNEVVLDVFFANQPLTAPTGSTAIGTAAKGLRGPVVVEKFDRDEADEDGVSYDVNLVEVDHEESGALVEIAAFSVTVTAIA
jgi:hypothetical protein